MTDIEKLQGIWHITSLEMDGRQMEGVQGMNAKISIEGDRFETTGMGAIYEGTMTVDAEARPKTLDMHFTAGPEAGNTSYGIYEVEGDTWRICLTTQGTKRPAEFATSPGSGIALEVLHRQAGKAVAETSAAEHFTDLRFEPVPEMQGEWVMVSCTLSGQPLDARMVKSGRRVVEGSSMSVIFGTNVYAKANFTIDRTTQPTAIDYFNTLGSAAGERQLGIFELTDDVLTLCMGAPGKPRPREFRSVNGDGRTFAVWRKK